MEFVQIEVNRDAYVPTDIHHTLTVAELKEILEDYPDDMPIIISHDNGYTYGGLDYSSITDGGYRD